MQDEQASQQRPAAGQDSTDTDEPQRRPATGEARVDEALASLDELAGLPVTEHPAVFEQVHRRLREVLGELDTGDTSAESPAGPASPAWPGEGAAHQRPGS